MSTPYLDWLLNSDWILSFLVVPLFVWGVIWYNNRFSSFRNKTRLLQREPFFGLQRLGFQLTDDAYIQEDGKPDVPVPAFLGLIEGYAIEICFNWMTGWIRHPHYRVRVYYEPGSRVAEEIARRQKKKLAQSNIFRQQALWFLKPVYAERKIVISKFYRPNAQALTAAAEELIEELLRLRLGTIAYCEGIALARKCSGEQ